MTIEMRCNYHSVSDEHHEHTLNISVPISVHSARQAHLSGVNSGRVEYEPFLSSLKERE